MAEAASAGAGGALQEAARGAREAEGEAEGDGDEPVGGGRGAAGVCVWVWWVCCMCVGGCGCVSVLCVCVVWVLVCGCGCWCVRREVLVEVGCGSSGGWVLAYCVFLDVWGVGMVAELGVFIVGACFYV